MSESSLMGNPIERRKFRSWVEEGGRRGGRAMGGLKENGMSSD
jgi:hypothetical protein